MSRPRLGVPLREVMAVSDRAVPVGHLSSVNIAGVYSFGRGLFKRGPLAPQETSYKSYNRLIAGEFVISQPKAWEGALALVTPEFDGWYLSPVFPTFSIDRSRLLPEYLSWFCRRSSVWFDLQQRSRGIGARRETVSPESFLSLEIPLPSVAEQRRIVDHIEAIAGKVEEARRLRGEAAEAVGGLLASRINEIFGRLARDCPPQPLSRFDPHVTSGPRNWAKHYDATGHRFYRAQDIGPAGAVLNDSKVYVTPPPGGQGQSARLVDGDLMIVITGATVGRVALFANAMEPGFVSQHVAICRLPLNRVNSEFVLWGLRGPDGQSQLLGQRYGQGKPGLNLENVGALSLPFPPIEEQQRVVEYLRRYGRVVEELAVEHESSAALIEGMLPSVLDQAFSGEL